MSSRESLSLGLTDRCTVAAYVADNTTTNGPNYTTPRDVTLPGCAGSTQARASSFSGSSSPGPGRHDKTMALTANGDDCEPSEHGPCLSASPVSMAAGAIGAESRKPVEDTALLLTLERAESGGSEADQPETGVPPRRAQRSQATWPGISLVSEGGLEPPPPNTGTSTSS